MVNTLSDFFNKFPSPYPFDVKKRLKEGYREKFDLLDEKPLIFPELSYKKIKIKNVLILGCGHTEGIYHSLRNPDIHFICVDISKNAIESSIKNSSSYNLTNVEFINTDLLSFNSDIKFDVIFASKVFQYLDNPLDGFLKSFSLLEKHGALIGSLPTSSMFSDINIMRQSLLDFGYSYENTEDIKEAFNVVSGLNGMHPARVRMVNGDKWIDEKDFVSRYLVPTHSSFTVSDLFAIFKSSGFYFQSWYSNNIYYPSALLRKDASKHVSLYSRIDNLPEIKKWESVCNIFKSSNDRLYHSFCLKKDHQYEFYDKKLLKDEDSFVSIRSFVSIKTIGSASESFAVSSNYKRKLLYNEASLCRHLNKPIKIKDLLKIDVNGLTSSDIIDLIKTLLESSVINLYR